MVPRNAQWSCRPSPTEGKTGASILTKTAATDRWASGVTGVTRRGSHAIMNAGGPCRCPSRGQPVDIRERNFTGSARESELPMVPLVSQGEQSLGRGKGQCFHRVSEGVKEGDCRGGWELQSSPGTSEETIPEGITDRELFTKEMLEILSRKYGSYKEVREAVFRFYQWRPDKYSQVRMRVFGPEASIIYTDLRIKELLESQRREKERKSIKKDSDKF